MKKIMIIAILCGLLVGCAETVDDIDTKSVDRWNALINNDYEKAYQYLAPSYRQLEDLFTFQMRIQKAKLNIDWNEVTFLGKQCDEDACTVNMKVNYTYKFSRRAFGEVNADSVVEENWIKDSGTWYYIPKKTTEL